MVLLRQPLLLVQPPRPRPTSPPPGAPPRPRPPAVPRGRMQQGPPIHVHIDGASLGVTRGKGKGTADAGGGPTDDNAKVFRHNKQGQPMGEDANLKSKLNGQSAGWKSVADYQDELPKVQGRLVCVNFLVTGSCFRKCASPQEQSEHLAIFRFARTDFSSASPHARHCANIIKRSVPARRSHI